ncbi:MAG TPA: cytidine deaminase [Caldimonas sp.]|jgi:cytidine deaminase
MKKTPPDSARVAAVGHLADEAAAAAERAHAPYSHFRVGAAVLGGSGEIYRGANVENASFGLGTCAERVALASARVGGETTITDLAIACIDAAADAPLEAKMPCGACRQWLQELAPNARVHIAGETRSFSVAELLPHPFTLRRP